MFRYLCTLTTLLISLGGCASYPDVNRERLESLPQHYRQFDALLAWEVRGAGSGTVIDGVFKNVRYDAMDNVEVWVAALDPAGKTRASSVAFVIPRQLRRDEIAPFSVMLPVPVLPGQKLHFTYKYQGRDGGGSDGGGDAVNWMQSFDAEVPRQ
jgi:hypothetical protein